MIIERSEFIVKLGRSGEAIELFKALKKQYGPRVRVLYQRFGPEHRLVMEGEHESLAKYEEQMAASFAAVGKVTSVEKLREVIENWRSHEIWEVIE